MNFEKCPVCSMPSSIQRYPREGYFAFTCTRCGSFRVSNEADQVLKESSRDDSQVALISGYIANTPGVFITEADVSRILNREKYGVATMAAYLLVAMGKMFPNPGENFQNPAYSVQSAQKKCANSQNSVYPAGLFTDQEQTDLLLFGKSAARSPYELQWLIEEVLGAQGYLKKGQAAGFLEISPKGWGEIDRLLSLSRQSNSGFVAMSFHSDFVAFYEQGLAPGIESAGYDPIRIDRVEHLNRIDDEILVNIKKSKFLVADFSMNRGGIYFEAGYALGLNIPVIWTVREDKLDEIHFDNRQYNFLTWQNDNLKDFQMRLAFRIEAAVGKGSNN